MCDAVLGATGSGDTLRELERSNSFVVPLDDDRGWYRYHHLFGQLLRAELDRRHPSSPPFTWRAPRNGTSTTAPIPKRRSVVPTSAVTSGGPGRIAPGSAVGF